MQSRNSTLFQLAKMEKLNPLMDKASLDLFLRQNFSIESSPWSVEEVFNSALAPAAWAPLQSVFKLDGEQSARLRAALGKARTTIRSGTCGITEDNAIGDCERDVQGSWTTALNGIKDLEDCALRCLACNRCRWISYSADFGDCSWFHSCSLSYGIVGNRFHSVLVSGTVVEYWKQQKALKPKPAVDWWRPGRMDSPQWAPGLCGPTDREGQCETDDRGSWNVDKHHITSMDECAAKCRQCARCAYVSLSLAAQHRDCSWYSECDLRDLRRPPRSGIDYNSTRVRQTLAVPVNESRATAVHSSVRIAVATLAVGSGARCGLVRWCQGVRRLQLAIERQDLVGWSVVPVILVRKKALQDKAEGAAPKYMRDCPGAQLVPIASEVMSAAKHCVRKLDATGAIPSRAYSPAWPRIINLCKWALFGLHTFDVVFYVDLDADPMPAATESIGLVGNLWRTMVPRLLQSKDVHLVATADSMSPVHGGVFLLRPSQQVLADGLRTLSTCVWNGTHGWNHIGAPRALDFLPGHLDGAPIRARYKRIAPSWPTPVSGDVGGVQHAFSTDAFRLNDWEFWYAHADQGLLWYELFLRSQRGVYSRWSTAHKISHEWGGNEKPWVVPTRPLSSLPVHQLAMRLRFLQGIDLWSAGSSNNSSLGSGTASECVELLWRMRRSIEEDVRFDAIAHRITMMPLARFTVW